MLVTAAGGPASLRLSEAFCQYRGQPLGSLFFCTSLFLFVGGFLILLGWKCGRRALSRVCVLRHSSPDTPTQPQGNTDPVFSLRRSLRMWAISIISAQHLPGKILMLLTFGANVCSVVTYFAMTRQPVEHCMQGYSHEFLVDVGFHVFYLLIFGVRFLAAEDEVCAWLDLRSLIDVFTIPPSLFGLLTGRVWLGLRFLRALYLLELPIVLQILNILESNTSVKLSRLVAVLVGSLLTSAGMVHLLENSGDFWSPPHFLTYFECVYFLVVTISTVGYGDVQISTTFGRFFIIVFISTALGMFASYVPEVIEIIANRKRFEGSYRNTSGVTHVVVCGHITLNTASAFMKEFLHEDRGDVVVHVLFLGSFHPDQELEAFFNLYFMKATFFCGSVLERKDQERVMLDKASACLILCDRFTTDQNNEDAANLMRVISVKQYCPNTRVIVQMLRHSSKAYLHNVPNWDWACGDAVICLAELKLGFMAQSCQVPGLSTLLANLFTMHSEVENKGESWQKLYREGLYNEIYTEHLSVSFTGMTYAQASKLCFFKLKLLLIGIEYQTGERVLSVLVNPSSTIRIKNQTLGFIIASSATDARRASLYCSACHSNINDLSKMRRCKCKSAKYTNVSLMTPSVTSLGCPRRSIGVLPSSSKQKYELWLTGQREQQHTGCLEKDVQLDTTGMFHWCPPMSLQDITLTRQTARELSLRNHVLVCVFGDEGSSLLGLGDFLMPLRASSLTVPELKTVVFLGEPQYFSREWMNINYFPKILFLPGSPLCGADLRALSVENCAMCVVLSAFSSLGEAEPAMQDKETILSCINLYHIHFSPEQSLIHTHASTHSQTYESVGPRLPETSYPTRTGATVPLLVDLVNTSNVQYVSKVDSAHSVSSLALTQAFAVGSVFSVDLLDSLVAATYFNANVPALICTLVTGGDTPLLEAQLAEDNQLQEGVMTPRLLAQRQRPKLAMLALNEPPLNCFTCHVFKDLFCKALDSMEILCFGLYRLLDPPNPSMKRFVITNPPAELPLKITDKVYCSVHFHQSHLLCGGHPDVLPRDPGSAHSTHTPPTPRV
ncbi:calcium-activated potassium channel subunit alpha-1-like [Brachyhypopomus gauderio]|uniref:calcium-activated potassium channel subunit alpha-1-like n=1 Tax=Brachyhypopomus gauderio TaxID=698409 RepID=UPI004041A945